MVKTASLYDNFCKTGNYNNNNNNPICKAPECQKTSVALKDFRDVIIWVQDGNCKKMARENFSVGVFYNISKN